MTRYIMNYNDYVEFFKEDTKVIEDEEEIICLEIKAVDNAKDQAWEFSIEWWNTDNDETGVILGINTSSIWALKSCYWMDDEETDSN